MRKWLNCVTFWIFFSAIVSHAQAAAPPYLRTIVNTGTGGASGDSVAIDNSYNAYVSGYFYNTVDFGSGGDTGSRTSASGSYDAFITKYTIDGTRVWTKTFGSSSDEEALSIASDGNSIYVTGYFSATVDFGTGGDTASRTSNGSADTFISKYQSDGTRVWTKTLGGTGWDEGNRIYVDGSSNIYVTGDYVSTVDFGTGSDTGSRTSNGGSDIYVTKYQSDGTRVWTKTFGSTGNEYGQAVVADSAGNVYTAGNFNNVVDFGIGGDLASRSSNGAQDAYLSKYQSDGTRVWTKTFGGTGSENTYDVSFDSSGNVYATGYYNDTVNFGVGGDGGSRTSNGFNDVYITKYQSDGTRVWTKTLGGADGDNGVRIAVDQTNGYLYTSGTFNGLVNFNPAGSDVIDAGSAWTSMFVTAYDFNGNYQWTRTGYGGNQSNGSGLAINQYEIYVSGNVYGTVDFDPQGAHDNKTGDSSSGSMSLTKYGNPVPSPTPTPTPSSSPASSAAPTATPLSGTIYPPEIIWPPAPFTFPVIYKGEASINAITLIFFPGAGTVTNYGVSYGLTESADNYSVYPIGGSGDRSITIGALNPDTTYYFILTPYNDISPGPESPVFSIKTTKTQGEVATSVVPFLSLPPSPTPTTVTPTPFTYAEAPKGTSSPSNEVRQGEVNQIVGKTLGIAIDLTKEAKKVVDQAAIPAGVIASGVATTAAATGLTTLLIGIIKIYSLTDRKIYFLIWDLLKGILQWFGFAVGSIFYVLFGLVPHKKNAKGKVFDSTTTKPLLGAYVICYSPSGNLATDFTNAMGEYAMSPKPDRYAMRVDMTGYTFPSILSSFDMAKYDKVYKQGEEIEIEKQGETISDYSIPLDGKLSNVRKIYSQIKSKLLIPVLSLWTIVTAVGAIGAGGKMNYLIIALSSLLVTFGQWRKRKV